MARINSVEFKGDTFGMNRIFEFFGNAEELAAFLTAFEAIFTFFRHNYCFQIIFILIYEPLAKLIKKGIIM